MSLVALLCVLVVVGIFMAVVPMDPTIRNIVLAVIACAVLVWLLSFFGVLHVAGLR